MADVSELEVRDFMSIGASAVGPIGISLRWFGLFIIHNEKPYNNNNNKTSI